MASPTPILPPTASPPSSLAPSTPAPSTLTLPGRRVLTLGRELGRGSTSTVYRAILESEHGVRRPIAVKVFDGITPDDRDAGMSSLMRATQRAACIRHPNVVATYEFAVLDPSKQSAAFVELVEGASLATLVDRYARAGRKVPLDLALFIATEIAEGLHGARTSLTPDGMQLGVAHLDLAAREILLSWNGEVKITDFGIGHAMRWGSSVRSLRAIAERANTMAPEIARGEKGDTRSDVFSLGVILREMLIGPRFAASPRLGDAEALEHAREGFVPTTFLELQLPKEVRAILARAMEIDPQRRFPHATAFAYELRRVAFSMGVGDGRVFLRHALSYVQPQPEPVRVSESDDGPTLEIAARLGEDDAAADSIPPDRTSGLIRKAFSRDDSHDDDGDIDEL